MTSKVLVLRIKRSYITIKKRKCAEAMNREFTEEETEVAKKK